MSVQSGFLLIQYVHCILFELVAHEFKLNGPTVQKNSRTTDATICQNRISFHALISNSRLTLATTISTISSYGDNGPLPKPKYLCF